MAAICPNCGKKLRIIDVKAECSKCGVSIPNFNWEKRLEEDSEIAEAKFKTFNRSMNRIAYSLWGTKLRVVRIILSFLPAIGFLLPWAYIKSDATSIGVDLLGIFTSGKSLIDVLGSFFGNSSLYFLNMGYENYAGTITFTMLSILLMLLSLVFIVVAFFLIVITCKKSTTKAMFVFDILSICSAASSAIMFKAGMGSVDAVAGFNFGNLPMYNAQGGVSWGFFVALVLLVVAAVVNLMVANAPAKSDEELEGERLARVEAKEKKQAEAKARREKEKEENEKRLAQEQAEKIAKAKANLEKKNK